MNCEFCQKPTHVWFECPNKPDGWRPGRLAKKSTGVVSAKSAVPKKAVGSSLPVDTPKPKFDRNAYQREYMRKLRAEQREYRARKK